MKTLLASLFLMASIILSGPANASDLEKLYPEQLKETKNLYQLAYRYFKGPGSLQPGEVLTPEMVKNPLRQKMFYELWRLLTLAVDAGYDISFLEEFGLVSAPNGFAINYREYPQWADMNSLFMSLDEPSEMSAAIYALKKKGFSQFDIDIVKNYLNNNNPIAVSKMNEYQLIAPYSQNTTKHNRLSIDKLVNLHESIEKSLFNSWNHWGAGLLNSLSLHKQRILISYLQDKLGYVAVGKLPITIRDLEKFEQELSSGQTLENLNKTLATFKQSADKE